MHSFKDFVKVMKDLDKYGYDSSQVVAEVALNEPDGLTHSGLCEKVLDRAYPDNFLPSILAADELASLEADGRTHSCVQEMVAVYHRGVSYGEYSFHPGGTSLGLSILELFSRLETPSVDNTPTDRFKELQSKSLTPAAWSGLTYHHLFAPVAAALKSKRAQALESIFEAAVNPAHRKETLERLSVYYSGGQELYRVLDLLDPISKLSRDLRVEPSEEGRSELLMNSSMRVVVYIEGFGSFETVPYCHDVSQIDVILGNVGPGSGFKELEIPVFLELKKAAREGGFRMRDRHFLINEPTTPEAWEAFNVFANERAPGVSILDAYLSATLV